MIVKAHTSFIGETGYNCHSRNFFKALHKLVPIQVRNFTVGASWDGYDNDEPHNKEYYIDDVLKTMLVEQTLNTPNGREEFSLYTKYKNEGQPDIHIVLNENNHHYFYDNYGGKKIAYNVWETTRYQDDFFERLKTFDQVWVPTQWQKDCTVEQGIPEWKVKVVPEGVDVKTYKPKNYVVSKPVNRPFRFILVGRWDYRKATKEIIETFTNTFSEDENVELLINVDNPFAYDGMNSTEERLEKYGIKHSGIKVLHHLSKDEYVETLKSADVFLSCARGEGWNLPLIEAMSCGVPSLYSNWGAQLEFAGERGIPVDIVGEVPANVQGGDLYFSWTKDAPGNFAEPNFEDLSKKMRDVVNNYTVYKKKALDESDEIREIFTWENAAKIANEILKEFVEEKKPDDESVAIVIAHPNTEKRKRILKECLSSIELPKILSVNYPVDVQTQELSDFVLYNKENPLLYESDFEKYGVGFYSWWADENGNKKTKPFVFEHSYAVYLLTRKAIEHAKLLNKKYVHIINYDYIISPETLIENKKKLLNSDVVLYQYDQWENGSFYCSAFISGRFEVLYEYFTKYNTIEEYYKSMPGFNVLEMNMFQYFQNESIIKTVHLWDSLKEKNKINLEGAHNFEFADHHGLIGKSFKEISDYFNCDKTTYHEYDKYYPVFLEKWREEPINIFEIGLDEGKSMNVWQYYFPLAKVWGMDISKEFENEKCKVFIGDQSKIDDLKNITNQVPKCKVIVDDGSHVAEHQIKTFYYLFQNMLDWGGVYIIEDTECSYWGPDRNVYGFETGYLNLIDWFTKLNHEVNSHYNLIQNKLNIKSITYGSNCIIIEKKELDEINDREYRFKTELSDVPNYKETKEFEMQNKININFIDGPFFEVLGPDSREYDVEFIDENRKEIIYQSKIHNNQWVKTNRKWYTDWTIRVKSNGTNLMEHKYDAKNKRVFVVFESSSLGDTIAWIPYVEEFRKNHNCKVIVSTFHNQLFQSEYPHIEFVKPGTTVNNLYALYRIGWFYKDGKPNYDMNKSDFTKISLQQTASDILGLEFKEIVPKIHKPISHKSEKPYICIANHSTAQSKYWNNPTGWQELVDYVKGLGYDVYLLSREEDGYMGNKNPAGVIKVDRKSLEEIGSILLGSKGFIGLGSGLSWYAWSLGVPTILISGFSEKYQEMSTGIHRIINENVCHGCFGRHTFDKGDWNWCPDHKGTDREFECTKTITFDVVKSSLNEMLGI